MKFNLINSTSRHRIHKDNISAKELNLENLIIKLDLKIINLVYVEIRIRCILIIYIKSEDYFTMLFNNDHS